MLAAARLLAAVGQSWELQDLWKCQKIIINFTNKNVILAPYILFQHS
jgi:hypothetical protein